MRHAKNLSATLGICFAGLFMLVCATRAEPVEETGVEPVERAGARSVEEETLFPRIRPNIDGSANIFPGTDLPPAKKRINTLFHEAGAQYPPAEVVLAAFKEERALDLYAKYPRQLWVFIHRYKILGASGYAGPKLKEGDMQVPEGLYKVTWVRGKSSYFRALKLNYPNAFDRKRAAAEKRTGLGGDIEIHGGIGSIGCLAMGDPSIEELYELGKKIGRRKITVVIAPFDMRVKRNKELPDESEWTKKLYEDIRTKLGKLPLPPQRNSVIGAGE